MKRSLLGFLLLFLLNLSFAQTGQLDPSFGNKGIVRSDIGSVFQYTNSARQVLINSDGTIFIISNYPTFVSRRLANGRIDSSYGMAGFSKAVTFNDVAAAMQPDGKIIIVGSDYESSGLIRITTTGIIDSTFGVNGIQSTTFLPTAVIVKNDGKILVTGPNESSSVVAQFNSNGSVDNTFNGNGLALFDFTLKIGPPRGMTDSVEIHTGSANTLTFQTDGKVLVGGSVSSEIIGEHFAIARYNVDGTLDAGFGNEGKQITKINDGGSGYALGIQTDGKIVMAGLAMQNNLSYFALARYNTNGNLDNSFNGTGTQTSAIITENGARNSLAFKSDGKIVIGGYAINGTARDLALACFDTDGSVDNSFGVNGILTTDFSSTDDFAGSLVLQNDDKIILAGYSNIVTPNNTIRQMAVARYNANGSLDNTFGDNGKLIGDYKQGYTVFNATVIQQDGKAIAGGSTWNGSSYDFALVRYNIDGSIDSTFGTNGRQITDLGLTDEIVSLALQANGKIIAAGNSDNRVSIFRFAVVRYNSDGTLDNSFSGDGKLLITPIGNSDVCKSVAVDNEGRIVLAGYTFIGLNYDSATFAVARISGDGTYDNTFSDNAKQRTNFDGGESFASSVAIQTDSKIVVSGRVYLNGKNRFALVRYNTDGTLDTDFSEDGKQTSTFGNDNYFGESMAIQNDGKIIVAGYAKTPGSEKSSFALARYNTNGNLDNTFSGDGFQSTYLGNDFNFGIAVAVSLDGKIAVGGTNDNFTIVLYKPDGSIDSTFGTNGIGINNIGVLESRIQSLAFTYNKLYAAGYAKFPGRLGVVTRYIFSDAGPLPITELDLKATPQNQTVLVQWQTTGEKNVAGFEIQRSGDGDNFSTIGYKIATGSYSVKTNYSTVDLQPLNGMNFYRLKILDKDGKVTFSKIVAVNMSNEIFTFKISPNPVRNILFIKATGESLKGTLRIIDAGGRNIREEKVTIQTNSSIAVNVNSLTTGIYTLQFVTPIFTQSKRFMKE